MTDVWMYNNPQSDELDFFTLFLSYNRSLIMCMCVSASYNIWRQLFFWGIHSIVSQYAKLQHHSQPKSQEICRDVNKNLKTIKILKILQILLENEKIWHLFFKLGLYLVRWQRNSVFSRTSILSMFRLKMRIYCDPINRSKICDTNICVDRYERKSKLDTWQSPWRVRYLTLRIIFES